MKSIGVCETLATYYITNDARRCEQFAVQFVWSVDVDKGLL